MDLHACTPVNWQMRSACAAVDRATPPPCTLWLRSGLLARYHCARRRMQCAMCQTSPRHVRSCVRRPEWRCLDTRVVSGLGARIVASLFFFRLHVRWRVFRYLCVSHVVAPWLWLDAAKEFWAIGGGAGARGGGRRAGGGEPARGSRCEPHWPATAHAPAIGARNARDNSLKNRSMKRRALPQPLAARLAAYAMR